MTIPEASMTNAELQSAIDAHATRLDDKSFANCAYFIDLKVHLKLLLDEQLKRARAGA